MIHEISKSRFYVPLGAMRDSKPCSSIENKYVLVDISFDARWWKKIVEKRFQRRGQKKIIWYV